MLPEFVVGLFEFVVPQMLIRLHLIPLTAQKPGPLGPGGSAAPFLHACMNIRFLFLSSTNTRILTNLLRLPALRFPGLWSPRQSYGAVCMQAALA